MGRQVLPLSAGLAVAALLIYRPLARHVVARLAHRHEEPDARV